MNRTLLLLLLPLSLAACGSAPAGQPDLNASSVSIGVDVGDSGDTATVTRTTIPATDTTPATVTYATTPGEGTRFVFTSRPGSHAAYITGFRILTTTVNGKVTSTTTYDSGQKLNTYVQSGYYCTRVRVSLPDNQSSCVLYGAGVDPDAFPNNGAPSNPVTLNFSDNLIAAAKAQNASQSQTTSIQFYGMDSIGHPVTINADNVQSSVTFVGN